ncbi:MAG: hypothetical protein AAGI46_14530 [Planctomycetota bacterium]
MTRHRRFAIVLGLLALAFAGRVLGQVVVAFDIGPANDWLPPMEAWYSRLVPYSVLLPAQVLILVLQAMHIGKLWRRPAVPALSFAFGLKVFAVAYALAMLLRYAVILLRNEGFGPEWWSGSVIPVTFHQVLAAYLFIWAKTRESGDRG